MSSEARSSPESERWRTRPLRSRSLLISLIIVTTFAGTSIRTSDHANAAEDPIIGLWSCPAPAEEDPQSCSTIVRIEQRDGTTYGHVTKGGGRCFRAGDTVWTIGAPSGPHYEGTSLWRNSSDCSFRGNGKATWDLSSNAATLTECSTDPGSSESVCDKWARLSFALTTAGKVTVYVEQRNPRASLRSDFGLALPQREAVCSNCDVGDAREIGHFETGTGMTFYLRVPGPDGNYLEYLSNDPDHAQVVQKSANEWTINWEDSTDDSFDDLVVRVTVEPDLTVMSWNVHGSENPPLRSGVAPEIVARGADLVGLQEIEKRQAEKLEAYLEETDPEWDMLWVTTGHDPFGRVPGSPPAEGHAILSRYPMSRGRAWNLPKRDFHERILQRAIVTLPTDEELFLYNTHLCRQDGNKDPECWANHQAGRTRQARAILRHMAADAGAVRANKSFSAILVGDLNARPDSPPVALLKREMMDVWEEAHPTLRPCSREEDTRKCGWTSNTETLHSRIDYILLLNLSALEVTSATTPGFESSSPPDFYRAISDHFPVIASFGLL